MDNWNLKVSLREAKETRSEKAAKIPVWKIYFEVGERILRVKEDFRVVKVQEEGLEQGVLF